VNFLPTIGKVVLCNRSSGESLFALRQAAPRLGRQARSRLPDHHIALGTSSAMGAWTAGDGARDRARRR